MATSGTGMGGHDLATKMGSRCGGWNGGSQGAAAHQGARPVAVAEPIDGVFLFEQRDSFELLLVAAWSLRGLQEGRPLPVANQYVSSRLRDLGARARAGVLWIFSIRSTYITFCLPPPF